MEAAEYRLNNFRIGGLIDGMCKIATFKERGTTHQRRYVLAFIRFGRPGASFKRIE